MKIRMFPWQLAEMKYNEFLKIILFALMFILFQKTNVLFSSGYFSVVNEFISVLVSTPYTILDAIFPQSL